MTISDYPVISSEEYPLLAEFAQELEPPSHQVVGLDVEVRQIRSTASQPVMSNSLVLAEAGTGKTTLVRESRRVDDTRCYYELNLSAILSKHDKNPDLMSQSLKLVFEEARDLARAVREDSSNTYRDVVLFIDEFHQIVQMSPVAVEAMKPILADSGAWGVRVIAATTYDEYHDFIASNQALQERFTRINLEEPDRHAVVSILRSVAKTYGVDHYFVTDHLFEQIYELTQENMKNAAQPRKSIMVLNSMVGWHREFGHPFNERLLESVLDVNYNVELNVHVDPTRIEKKLNERVFQQKGAVALVARRLQIALAKLNNPRRPRASFLLAGTSGVGKTELVKGVAELLFGDAQKHLIRIDGSEFGLDSALPALKEKLTREISNRPNSVVLMDEFEKMSTMCGRLFLQILDDGHLSDSHGRPIAFNNSYVFITTNAAKDVFAAVGDYTGNAQDLDEYSRVIYRSITDNPSFPDELVGRVDEIALMVPLREETRQDVIEREIFKMSARVAEIHGVVLRIDNTVMRYLGSDMLNTDSGAGGARDDVRRVASEITSKVAAFINKYGDKYRTVDVSFVGTLIDGNMYNNKTDGQIVVSGVER